MAAKQKLVYILGAVAVVLALAASASLYSYLKKQEVRVQEAVATSKVVVAAVDIPLGTIIQQDKIKVVDWPKSSQPEGVFSSEGLTIGRASKDVIFSGEPIIEGKLVPKEGQGGGILTYKIPEGHRAMTVPVDQVSGVAGFITPGSMVDVVVTTQSGQPVSKIVLQNVPVLATGQVLSEQKKDEKPQVVPTVTVDVTPEDAEKLAIASTQGKLQLVLRRTGDRAVAKTSGATVAKVVGGSIGMIETDDRPAKKHKTIKIDKPVEVPMTNVEVWRGDKKSVQSFSGEKQ